MGIMQDRKLIESQQVAEGNTSLDLKVAIKDTLVGHIPTLSFIFPMDEQSGDREATLHEFQPGEYVSDLSVKVAGSAFNGRLQYFEGITVVPGPVFYNTNGDLVRPEAGEISFIVDFATVCSVLNLSTIEDYGVITLILPWFGNDFAEKSLYPKPVSVGGNKYKPKSDAVGNTYVELTGMEVTKLLVQVKGSAAGLTLDGFMQKCVLRTGTYPANVKASVNGRPPFWSHPGILKDEQELVGLKDEIGILLDGAVEPVAVKLLLEHDTAGVISVTPETLTGSGSVTGRKARASWGGSERIDFSLHAREKQSLKVIFHTEDKAGWKVNRLIFDIKLDLPAWNSYPDNHDAGAGSVGMKIDGRFSVARKLVFEEEADLFGFILPLKTLEKTVELRFELLEDKDDLPYAGRVIAVADVLLPVQEAPKNSEILFPSSVKLASGTICWLVAQARIGSAEWQGIVDAESMQMRTMFTSEGDMWREYPKVNMQSPAVLATLLRSPVLAEKDPVLEIGWNSYTSGVDRTDKRQQVELELPEEQVVESVAENGVIILEIDIDARASGMMSIESATGFYRSF